jgi:predicted nucleic acid-binding protein
MIIVDTGFWVALVDQKDTYHERAKQALKQYLSLEQSYPFQNLLL